MGFITRKYGKIKKQKKNSDGNFSSLIWGMKNVYKYIILQNNKARDNEYLIAVLMVICVIGIIFQIPWANPFIIIKPGKEA